MSVHSEQQVFGTTSQPDAFLPAIISMEVYAAESNYCTLVVPSASVYTVLHMPYTPPYYSTSQWEPLISLSPCSYIPVSMPGMLLCQYNATILSVRICVHLYFFSFCFSETMTTQFDVFVLAFKDPKSIDPFCPTFFLFFSFLSLYFLQHIPSVDLAICSMTCYIFHSHVFIQ